MNSELKPSGHLHGFARRLVAEGLIDEDAALEAVDLASKNGKTVLAWLTSESELETDVLAATASVEYGVPLLDVTSLDMTVEIGRAHV